MPGRLDLETVLWSGALILIVASSAVFGAPAPLGVVFLGIVIGSLVAFISMGMVLVYRTNRIINFAQADIGTTGAVLAVMLIGQKGWSYFAGVAIGLVVAVALGALIEVAVVRRFFKAPRLILTVATIGVTQVLVFAELTIPRMFGRTFVNVDFLTPFAASFKVRDPTGTTPPVLFDGNHLLAIIAVPLVALGIGAFLKLTRIGTAARAISDDAERASLLGIPVKRISTVVWVVAALVSGIGAFLRAPTVGLPVLGGAFDSGLLVRSLAPAVVGRMQNLRVTFLSAVTLGVIDQVAFYRTHGPALSNTILFVVILLSLLLTRRGDTGRGQQAEGGTWRLVRQARPIPARIKRRPEVVAVRRASWVLIAGAALAAGTMLSTSRVAIASLIAIYAIVGASLVVLTGWAGQVSLGHIGFFAVGGALSATLAIDHEMHLLLALALAGLGGSALAVVIGLPALRIRGLYLAASTVAFGLFVSSAVLDARYFDWLVPRSRYVRPIVLGLDLNSERTFYFFTLAFLLLTFASVTSLRRSRIGRVLIGSRDNERAALSYGVNITRARLAAFALSGFYAALAGGLYAMHQNAVIASALGPEKSLQVFVMVAIGGLSSLAGVVMGSIYFFGTQYLLSGAASLLASGLGMLVILMIVPGGLGQLLADRRQALVTWLTRKEVPTEAPG